jgi:hypothetical protein
MSSNAFFNPNSPDVHEVFHPGCVPTLTVNGLTSRDALSGVDGRRSIEDLATEISTAYPDRFELGEEAVRSVQKLVGRFGEAKLLIDV